jgi:hypothetical protein
MGTRDRGASHPALATLATGMAALILVPALILSLGASAVRAAQGTGAIAGTVVAAASPHEPLRGISVTVYEAEGPEAPVGFATTNAGGEYDVKGLRGGSYEVEFSAEGAANYVTQFYREASTLASAKRVAVLEGNTTHEIDAELLGGGKITGTVTEAEGGAAVAGAGVTVYELGVARTFGFAVTDASGHYTIEGLESGTYYVGFSPGFEGFPGGEGFEEEGPPLPEGVSGRNLVGQFYPGVRTLSEAAPVHVVREVTTEGIDAQLQRGAEIEGTVTDAYTHAPIQGAWVTALGRGEAVAAVVSTDRNGHYVLAGLESGSYTVSFEAPRYATRFYLDQSSQAFASPIGVTRPLVTAGIDAALFPKAPANTAAPVASGAPAVGQTLSCARGTWTGSPAPAYAYAWLRDGVPIAGANATTYTVQLADQGNGVTCRVTATNRNGSAAAISNTLIVPVPSPPPPPPQVRVVGTHISVRGRAARVELLCAGSRCQGTLELVERLTIRHRHRRPRHQSAILGGATYLVQAGQTETILVPLNNRGRHALAHARRHRLKAQLRITLVSGSNTLQAVTLRAIRHR